MTKAEQELPYEQEVTKAIELTVEAHWARGGVLADHSTWLDDTLERLDARGYKQPLRDLVRRVYVVHYEEFFDALGANGWRCPACGGCIIQDVRDDENLYCDDCGWH